MMVDPATQRAGLIHHGRGILLDIEGTVSPIHFVFEVMFPYAVRELEKYLQTDWGSPECAAARDQIAIDEGQHSWETWPNNGSTEDEQRANLVKHVRSLMAQDKKSTGLKELQGLIWRNGFETGELKSELFDDVPTALRNWHEGGQHLRVYSSGSVAAQKLFFGNTEHGDLLPLFTGHYDTKIGGKREPASYQRIVNDWDLPANEILFLSDVVEELDAAREAGMHTGLSRRPGNPPVPDGHDHEVICSFDDISLGS